MARRTIVHLEDDLSGGAAEESVRFALDGRVFEIDLSSKNAAQLRELFAPYIGAGRPVRAGRGRFADPPAMTGTAWIPPRSVPGPTRTATRSQPVDG